MEHHRENVGTKKIDKPDTNPDSTSQKTNKSFIFFLSVQKRINVYGVRLLYVEQCWKGGLTVTLLYCCNKNWSDNSEKWRINRLTDCHSILIIHCIISVYNKIKHKQHLKKVIQGLWKNAYLLYRIIIYFRYPVHSMMIIVLVPFKVLHGDEGCIVVVVVVASINKVATQKNTASNLTRKSSQSRFYFPFSFSSDSVTVKLPEWESGSKRNKHYTRNE